MDGMGIDFTECIIMTMLENDIDSYWQGKLLCNFKACLKHSGPYEASQKHFATYVEVFLSFQAEFSSPAFQPFQPFCHRRNPQMMHSDLNLIS
jgi:hypothetical protein